MFCGIDEAGRGSVMGPLVVASVVAEDDTELLKIGVRDSKRLSSKMRERMYDEIVASYSYRTVVISSAEIDSRRNMETLNEIEMDMFIDSVRGFDVDRVYADCPDVNESHFGMVMSVKLGIEVISKHRADDTFPVVSAASIIAKVTRDRMISDISEEMGMNIGSGYPSDNITMELIEKWIKENRCAPPYTRCSWDPVKRMLLESMNTKITEW